MRKPIQYPMGSISSGTMRPEDLIPTFLYELRHQLRKGPKQSRATRKAHFAILNNRRTAKDYWESDEPIYDLDLRMSRM